MADGGLDFHGKLVAVDLRGVFLCQKHEMRPMLSAGGGVIVNTASFAGLIADPGMVPCVAVKRGVIRRVRAAAIVFEYAQ
jgi:NAD(P)-dependent dehydrogenase (short-subunit alcohol dehydrogenase family)